MFLISNALGSEGLEDFQSDIALNGLRKSAHMNDTTPRAVLMWGIMVVVCELLVYSFELPATSLRCLLHHRLLFLQLLLHSSQGMSCEMGKDQDKGAMGDNSSNEYGDSGDDDIDNTAKDHKKK